MLFRSTWDLARISAGQDNWLTRRANNAALTKKTKPQALNKDRRRHLVDTAVSILSEGFHSKFEFEAACRHGFRRAFCLDGWRWAEADATAADIVAAAFRQIGAQRPSWLQGQPEINERKLYSAYRYCDNCHGILEDHQSGRFCSRHCANVQVQRRYHVMHKSEERAYQKAWRAANPEKKRASWQRARAHWDLRECESCGKQFNSRPDRDNRFCSSKCYGVTLVKPAKQCRYCGADFRSNQAAAKYCCRSCAARHREVLRCEAL